MKITSLFSFNRKTADQLAAAVFAEEVQSSCKLWVLKNGAEFLMLDMDSGPCMPVWSDRHKMLTFLEDKHDTVWRSMAVPLHLFFTVWWPEVRYLSPGIGINWCDEQGCKCIVSGKEFERLSGRPEW